MGGLTIVHTTWARLSQRSEHAFLLRMRWYISIENPDCGSWHVNHALSSPNPTSKVHVDIEGHV